MKKTILVTGGAGYIGSHTAKLLSQKYNIVILDTFVHNQKLEDFGATVIKKDFGDRTALDHIFTTYNVDAVMHFAAFIEVGESVKEPQRFYHNNVIKTITLLDAMLAHNVKKIIFSSSCAVYGEPVQIPITEKNPYAPISPYGKNKLAIEFALQDYAQAYDLKYVALRYFNVAGAMIKSGLGEQHAPETHIIPLMLRAIKNNKTFKIFGTDYDTKDGSCIRDYIHVQDIANGHALALKYLDEGGKSDFFNLGSGKGFSVKEMICMAEKETGQKMNVKEEARRPGDPAVLLADQSKAQETLGWEPKFSDLEHIMKSALAWEEQLNPIKNGTHLRQKGNPFPSKS